MSVDKSKKIVTGISAKRSARYMDIGNMIVVLIPFPLLIFWFGMAIAVYIFTREHPNIKVGKYIQNATYRFYGITGTFMGIGIFLPGNGFRDYIICWIIAMIILIPTCIWNLYKIQKDEWLDLEYLEH